MTIPKTTRLENAAIIYPCCRTRKYAAMFRLTVTMDAPVEPDLLDQALQTTMERFPSFGYTLRNGAFWWYLRRLNHKPGVGKTQPFLPFSFRSNGGYLFKLGYEGACINLDVFHALTDGTGGMTFLLSLAAEYARLRYGSRVEYGKWVFDPREEPTPEEIEDSFDHFSGTKGSLDSETRAYHVQGREERPGRLNNLRVSVDSDQLRSLARKHDCTVTEFVSSLLFASLQEVRAAQADRRTSPFIRIEVPVNLRPIYGRKTLRNFSSYVHLGLDVRNGEVPFDEIVRDIKLQKQLEIQPRRITTRVAANVALEDNVAIGIIPLFIKKPIINLINHLKGDNYTTYTLSNIGQIELPAELAAHVRDLDFMLGRTRQTSGACACVSYDGRMTLNLSRKIAEDAVEQVFLRRLRELGLSPEVRYSEPSATPAKALPAKTAPKATPATTPAPAAPAARRTPDSFGKPYPLPQLKCA